MSFTFLYQMQIAEVIDDLVLTYLPEGGTIYDPTVGAKSRQLKQIKKGKLDIKYELITSDLKPTGNIQASVFNLPLQDNSVDLTIYDPPFVPSVSTNDKPIEKIFEVRAHDYGINKGAAITIEEVRRFYSKAVIAELMRVTKKYLFIRGQDFYFPRNSYEVYYFWDICISQVKELGLTLRALHINKYNHGRLGLYRARLRKYERPLVNHSYIAVIPKGAAP